MPAATPADPFGAHEQRLVNEHTRLVDADKQLFTIIDAAYQNSQSSLASLNHISAEIEQRVAKLPSTESPSEALELHAFLLRKQKEIIQIVAAASDEARRLHQALHKLTYLEPQPPESP